MVDLPNSLDGEWNIDVKKSVARPPSLIRDKFKQIARLTIEPAVRVYRYRGKIPDGNSPPAFYFPWSTSVKHGRYHYSINRNHPIVADVIRNYPGSDKKMQVMLRLIEETVPVPLIVLNNSNNPDQVQKPFEDAPSDELRLVIKEIWDSLIKSGVPEKEAKKRLQNIEPFSEYPGFVDEFIHNQLSGGKNE